MKDIFHIMWEVVPVPEPRNNFHRQTLWDLKARIVVLINKEKLNDLI